MISMFRTPRHELIEQAVKCVAERSADVLFHEQMASYYKTERDRLNPADSVTDAYDYARLFQKWTDALADAGTAERKLREAKAKHAALLKSSA